MQLSKETKTDEGIRYAEWQEPYQQALLELDQKKLRDHIAAADGCEPLLGILTITLLRQTTYLIVDEKSPFHQQRHRW